MPLLETKGAASAQGFGEFAKVGAANYIEDVFSTYLYTGNSPSTQTITNGIDLAGKGGMVWVKSRVSGDGSTYNNILMDTARGTGSGNILYSNLTLAAQTAPNAGISSFNSNGFSLRYDDGYGTNYPSGGTFASWTFRKQPKFFDVVTYTGTGSSQTISHSLGSTPGCIIIKKLDSTTFNAGWAVYHRSLTNPSNYYLVLNNTSGETNYGGNFISGVGSTTFTVDGNSGFLGLSGSTYVAYLFAHDAGGFGLTGTDNVISCGSYTTDVSGNADINLGYEPQWFLTKITNSTGSWSMRDNMRGWGTQSGSSTSNTLFPNSSAAESTGGGGYGITSTGVAVRGINLNSTFIYIAIRRGPMKTPTTGTSVFSPVLQNGGSFVTTNFPVDSTFVKPTAVNVATNVFDRLRSSSVSNYAVLDTATTAAELTGTGAGLGFDNNTGYEDDYFGASNRIYWNFRRAPGFFDVVCYTGTGLSSTQAWNHNLGVVPELIIVKSRNTAGTSWAVYQKDVKAALGFSESPYAFLNSTAAFAQNNDYWSATTPTSTQFFTRGSSNTDGSGRTYVAYLFASCPGVSKVGSYTGTGALQTINCGFTGGARFVLIKRADSTGDWWVYDSARGISSGNDPYLFLNSTAAEVTGTNYVDTTSVGFQVTAAAPAGLNANGGTFVFLAVA